MSVFNVDHWVATGARRLVEKEQREGYHQRDYANTYGKIQGTTKA